MKCTILVDILLLIGVVYLFSMCSSDNKHNTTNAPYELNHYIDTVNGHVILTTVCYHSSFGVSVNTLELNK